MSIGDFMHSKRWKLMQNYIYSWGASIVLIGALFKLEHIPGAGFFLGIGLSIEAIIFFISAFEPLLELPDWRAIYPQLRTGTESERDLEKYKKADKEYPNFFGSGGGGGFDLAGLPDDQIKNLKESLDKLSATATGLKDITNATVATKGFVDNLNQASESINSVVDANNKVSASMDESVQEIAKTYQSAAESMQSSVKITSEGIVNTMTSFENSVNDSTKKVGEYASKLQSSTAGLDKGSNEYTDNLVKLNKNISAINTAYELHLKGASQVEVMVSEYSKGVGEMGKLLNSSVEETKKFNQNTKEINSNIQALNDVYGRMLGALNGKK